LKIVALSDTHSYHRKVKVPDGDVLIHAGDFTFRGELPVIEDFCNWMRELPHKHKILICGNHETGIEYGYKRQPFLDMVRKNNITYLENSMTEVEGLLIYGSPITPFFCGWEFNRTRGKEIAEYWAKIPESTNLLLTHGPSKNVLDEVPQMDGSVLHEGCEDLAKRISELKHLRLVIHGHIHSGYGRLEKDNITYVNASICTNEYASTNEPIVIDL
jgi:Icc-related predicted phosphoesterase